MAITHYLERNGRVLVRTYTDPLDLNELVQHIHQLHEEVFEQATHKIHIISDFSAVTQLPKNVSVMSSHIDEISHPMEGVAIVVTGNLFVMTLIRVLNTLNLKHKMIQMKTLAEALAYVDKLLAEEKQRM
jgi:hypothetical protein